MEFNEFLSYCIEKKILDQRDINYVCNSLMTYLCLDEPIYFQEVTVTKNIDQLLAEIIDKYFGNDTLFECQKSKLISLVMDKPSTIQSNFYSYDNPKMRTQYFYQYCKDVNYIKCTQLSLNEHYQYVCGYGRFDITINCAKPEKDPHEIALLKTLEKANKYPTCPLCIENEGYFGSVNQGDRANHRMIIMQLHDETYYFQYSPYSYFNEHAILISEKHKDMVINNHTFLKLLDFVDQYPHYFIGSNADLPIVGGSLLTHDHYQAGVFEFAINRATVLFGFYIGQTKIEVLNWPMSVIRLFSEDKQNLIENICKLYNHWCSYSNEQLNIVSSSENQRHNTVTPIARYNNGYEMTIVLRNNRKSEQYPDGIFHPHKDKHHIKKENIGLIEVMGLAVLPERLIKTKRRLIQVIEGQKELPSDLVDFHSIYSIALQSQNPSKTIDEQIGSIFVDVLCDCAVFKQLEDLIDYVKGVYND